MLRDDLDTTDRAAVLAYREELLALAAAGATNAAAWQAMAEDLRIIADGIGQTPRDFSPRTDLPA